MRSEIEVESGGGGGISNSDSDQIECASHELIMKSIYKLKVPRGRGSGEKSSALGHRALTWAHDFILKYLYFLCKFGC